MRIESTGKMIASALALVLGAVGCGAEASDGLGGNDPFGKGGANGNGNGNGGAGGGSSYFPDELMKNGGGATGMNCGLERFNLEKLPGELALVLDRSGSMLEYLGNSNQSKWDAMVHAVDQTVKATESSVMWGLNLFPNVGGNGCTADGNPEVGVAINNYMPIMASIMTNVAGDMSYTPTRVAVQSTTTYLDSLISVNPKFILLATDGKPNCAPGQDSDMGDDAETLKAVGAALAAGFPVFVLGVALQGEPEAEQLLNQMAEAGGRQRAGGTKYYPANSQADLVAALSQIAGQIVSCTFNLGKVPPSPHDVAVDVSGMRVPHDTTRMNGWEYGTGMTSIELFGSYCENIKNGELKDVQFIFGCPGMPIP